MAAQNGGVQDGNAVLLGRSTGLHGKIPAGMPGRKEQQRDQDDVTAPGLGHPPTAVSMSGAAASRKQVCDQGPGEETLTCSTTLRNASPARLRVP